MLVIKYVERETYCRPTNTHDPINLLGYSSRIYVDAYVTCQGLFPVSAAWTPFNLSVDIRTRKNHRTVNKY